MTMANKFFIGLTLWAMSASASAGVVYHYDRGPGVFGGGSGLAYDSVHASFDEDSNQFTWQVDFAGAAADGGWLVVSPGPNPKSTSGELGIAYLDADSGNVWVYAYNGENNDDSYLERPFLAFFEDAYTTVGDVATLSFDATAINLAQETGFAFGSRIGIWYHPSANVTAVGGAGGLDLFDARSNGWLDTNFDGSCAGPHTGCITVPEPGSLPLILLGSAFLALRRRLVKTAM